jgi:hypothetical protein
MAASPIVVRSKAGIKRDGTKFEGDYYVDGQWVRFQRGLPRKIGGYKNVTNYLTEISRGIKTFTENQDTYVHTGSFSYLQKFVLDENANVGIVYDRTPLTLNTAVQNSWQFDVLYDSVNLSPSNKIIASAAPNLKTLYNSTSGQIFIGDVRSNDRLEELALPLGVSASGGVCVLHPYLTIFGTDGSLAWSVPGNPADLLGEGSGNARIAAQKIVRGLPLRGGPGNAPAGLYWSTDAVVRASFVGGAQIFQFDTISSQSSVIAPMSIIEYDGVYFWIGADRFYMFNGVVRDVENVLNINYFFDGLNREYAQKIFAYKVPRYGEIWWCYPRGSATECTHAIIYNVKEQTWYDTELPNGGRSAGEFVTKFGVPFLTGVEFNTSRSSYDIRITENNVDTDIRTTQTGDIRVLFETDNYKFWQHEYGVDAIDVNYINAIESYFETSDISALIAQGKNKSMRCELMEPDFVQQGDMQVQITGRANSRSKEVVGDQKTFVANPTTPYEQVVYFKDIRREMRFRFLSNTIGGDYQMGQVIAHLEEADGTVLGATN